MTKIVTVTLGEAGGSPENQGWVILNYSAPDGGRTNLGAQVVKHADGSMPTWDEVALTLVNSLGRQEWPNEIIGKASGNALRLVVPDHIIPDLVFSAEWNPTLDQSAPHELNPPFVTIAEETF